MTWEHVLSSINTVVCIVIGMKVLFLDGRQKRIEDLEADRERRNEDSIRQKFEIVESKLMLPITELRKSVEEMSRRLGRGDADFDRIEEQATARELKTQGMILQLRTDMATKSDLKDLAKEFEAFRLACRK